MSTNAINNALAKNYGALTPEERFRLILAAGGRRDEAERDRLVRAGGRLVLSFADHAPFSHAFDELAHTVYIELLDEAARYDAAMAFADSTDGASGRGGEGANETDDVGSHAVGSGRQPLWQRSLDLVLASGYVLRTKADGWKLFCEGWNIPPFVLWEHFAGYDRLQQALALTERAAFTAEGYLRWLNDIRPAGEPELTEVLLTAQWWPMRLKRRFANASGGGADEPASPEAPKKMFIDSRAPKIIRLVCPLVDKHAQSRGQRDEHIPAH